MIREATKDDAPVMVALHVALLNRGWNAQAFLSFYEHGEVIAFIAEQDGVAIGYIFCWQILGECEVMNVGVLDAFQGQGIATALCDTAIARARHLQAAHMHLEVALSNLAARALYEKLGFETMHRRKDYYTYADGVKEDALTMRIGLT